LASGGFSKNELWDLLSAKNMIFNCK
jgi:hypothetical protein